MNNTAQQDNLSQRIAQELPFLRRYARALTGAQESGDDIAVAALEAILDDRSIFSDGVTARVGLFHTFHKIWSETTPTAVAVDKPIRTSRALVQLSKLAPNSREALLLRSIEEFSIAEIAAILQIGNADVQRLLAVARSDLEGAQRGKVLVIEDEAIIAADISAIVEGLGHAVTGIARTRETAVEMGAETPPDLLLVDIQLADNSSGIDAAHDLLAIIGPVPVIFITAFPERLLTGQRPEPAFLISKPYKEDQVIGAVSQARFFASTETPTTG